VVVALGRVVRCETGQVERGLAEYRHERQQAKADLEGSESAPGSAAEIDSTTDHLLLPPKEEADKLLRYGAMIAKQLNHAIAELERLQALRKEHPLRGHTDDSAKQSQQIL